MFKKKSNKLDEQINAVLGEMAEYGPDSPEYPELLTTLERLSELRRKDHPRFRPSADAIVGALASVGGIVLIVAYEQRHVLSSKAFDWIKIRSKS